MFDNFTKQTSTDSVNKTKLEIRDREKSENDKCGNGESDDECKLLSNSSCTKEYLGDDVKFRSGVSNPQGFLGEVATYQNKTLYAQYAEVS